MAGINRVGSPMDLIDDNMTKGPDCQIEIPYGSIWQTWWAVLLTAKPSKVKQSLAKPSKVMLLFLTK
ncbi:hypothetical protein MAR_028141 [Mya arenaria]|uniref:Uncharacterized protein n=1 Tax=Mya arenaria TaxID=6604 RepID=A0ABY7DFP8_MYAAR|nr:hypothetical protein MAR_028141 [Mya arenaria]